MRSRSSQEPDDRLQIAVVLQQPLEGREEPGPYGVALRRSGAVPAGEEQPATAELDALPATEPVPFQEGSGVAVLVEMHRAHFHHAVRRADGGTLLPFR